MNWETAWVIKRGIDEPEEGQELAWAEKKFYGEALTPRRDQPGAPCPRARLSQPDIDLATLAVVTAAGRELVVIDRTDAPEVEVPPQGHVYVRLGEGEDADDAYLYFHAQYDGSVCYANYDYYPSVALPHGFVGANAVSFCEGGSGRWRSIGGGDETQTQWVRFGETGVHTVIPDAEGRLWALTAESRTLAAYDTAFSGYLECRGVAWPGMQYLGNLAQSFMAFVHLTADGKLRFRAFDRRRPQVIPSGALVRWEEEDGGSGAIAVRLAYRRGEVRSGRGSLVYRFRNALVTNRTHAQILADELYGRLRGSGARVTAEVTAEHYAPPGSYVRVGRSGGDAGVYLVTASALDLNRFTARLEMVADRPGGAVYELE